tara:strand:+ start:3364 stop:3546 length:183 start_codon:yes stop_codon:yes gene_type:complete
LLFTFLEIINGAAKTVPKNILPICKIVKKFTMSPKKGNHYLPIFINVNTFLKYFFIAKKS